MLEINIILEFYLLGNEETENGFEKGEAILGWSIRNINLVTKDRKN